MHEPCGDFGLLAFLFREQDPKFSAEMQWQFAQNSHYLAAGIGGFFPAFAGYRRVLTDKKLPAEAPDWGSRLFPKTGVVLRDHFPSQRETYLHMIVGDHREHYDDDSGSFVLYGKGRALIDEFGYTGAAPADDHSMILCQDIRSGAMSPVDFKTGAHFDFVEGNKQTWTRQIVMIKGTTSDAASYVVINDVVDSSQPVTWRAWLAVDQIEIKGHFAYASGREDVDLDIAFVWPNQLSLSQEQRSRTSGSGMHPNWQWRAMSTTMTGLSVKPVQQKGTYQITTVLFPRLKRAARPTIKSLAGGKVIRVDHQSGTDFVFLSTERFSYDQGGVAFEGKAGCIQTREGKPILQLVGPGRISYGDQQLKQ